MLELITGLAGTGKTKYVLDAIQRELEVRPLGPMILLLLPEHMTYRVERELATRMERSGRGFMRCQVYGFRRFAQQVLQETGGLNGAGIDELGRQLIIKRILDENGDKLSAFARAARQRGFSSSLGDIIREFKSYGITPELLGSTLEHIEDKRLAGKLSDLQLLYSRLNEFMAGRYSDGNDLLDLLAEKLPKYKAIDGAEVWLDGFLFFNPQERVIIEELLARAQAMHITLTTDGSIASAAEGHIFNRAYNTANRLRNIAGRLGVDVKNTVLQESHRQAKARPLQELARQFPNGVYHAVECDAKEMESLRLVEAANCQLECQLVAADIIRLVRDKGYKWRDIGILVRNQDAYGDILPLLLQDYRVPFFSDSKRPCAHHPVAELLRSSLAAVRTWQYEDIFRAVKTGFFDLTPEQVDTLENYVLEFGIRGRKLWSSQEEWQFVRHYSLDDEGIDEANEIRRHMADQLRRRVAEPLNKLYTSLKQADSVREITTAIYDYLLAMQVPEKLEQWSKDAEAEENLALAKEHQQVWDSIMDLMDQLVEISGEDKLPMKEYETILTDGFDGLQVSLIPPGLDYVNIASFDQNSLDNIKAVYILGTNAGIMPRHTSENAILSDADRRRIKDAGQVEITVIATENSFNEQYLLYKGFTQSREYLWVSYSLSDSAGNGLEPAEPVRRIRSILPQAQVETVTLDSQVMDDGLSQELFVAEGHQAMSELVTALRYLKESGQLSDTWRAVYNWALAHSSVADASNDQAMDGFADANINLTDAEINLTYNEAFKIDDKSGNRSVNKETRNELDKLIKGLFARYNEDKLPAKLAELLYTRYHHLRGSVTRFEGYQQCPFQYCAKYGLKLEERHIRKFGRADLGTLLHGVLKEFGERLNKEGRRWGSLREDERTALCSEILYELAPRLQSEILSSSKQYEAQLRRIERIIQSSVERLCEFDKVSCFHPYAFEESFGSGTEGRLSLIYKLENRMELDISGQIDRIDISEDGKYFLIMDYKTGKPAINLMEVYYGLRLQLLVYMLVARQLMNADTKDGEPRLPAGMLYFMLRRPISRVPGHMTEEAAKKELYNSLKMPGWVLADSEVIRAIDSEQKFISVKLKTNGEPDKRSMANLKKLEDFYTLMDYIELRLKHTGQDILSGQIKAEPYKEGDRAPCTYCSYRAVCGFDSQLGGFGYRRSKIENDNDAIMEEIYAEIEEESRKQAKKSTKAAKSHIKQPQPGEYDLFADFDDIPFIGGEADGVDR